jgi:hypothetical protein
MGKTIFHHVPGITQKLKSSFYITPIFAVLIIRSIGIEILVTHPTYGGLIWPKGIWNGGADTDVAVKKSHAAPHIVEQPRHPQVGQQRGDLGRTLQRGYPCITCFQNGYVRPLREAHSTLASLPNYHFSIEELRCRATAEIL